VEKTGIGWKVNLKADKSYTYKHKVLFPAEDGFYYVKASVGISGYGPLVINNVIISIAGKEGKAKYPGTKIPGIGDPILLPVYTVTPGPSPTPVETPAPNYP
jgi:hypothetical protein